jgi:SNF2 family DNA or RNA helicase
VLSPAALRDVWIEEIERWTPDLDYQWVSYGSLCDRVMNDKGTARSKVVPRLREGLSPEWDTIICDEAHYLKNRGTNWTIVVGGTGSKKPGLRSERLYLATGTPMPNWGHEIFMFLRLLYPGDPRFSNYWGWVEEHFKTWNPPYAPKTTEVRGLHRGLTWEEVAVDWGIAGRWLRRDIDDVLPDLPPMTAQTIGVDMTPAQERAYKRLKKEWMAVLPETGNLVVSWNDGGIYSKMLQCSTGLSTLDLGERNDNSGKLDVLEELVRERTHPVLIFCIYKNTAEAAARRLRGLLGEDRVGVVSSLYSGNDRLKEIARFRAGEYQALVGTLGTMSEGHTLTRADTCIFLERSPRPVTNYQARGRIRRFGQMRPTLSIDLVTRGTVDGALAKLVSQKADEIELALTGFQLAAAGT